MDVKERILELFRQHQNPGMGLGGYTARVAEFLADGLVEARGTPRPQRLGEMIRCRCVNGTGRVMWVMLWTTADGESGMYEEGQH